MYIKDVTLDGFKSYGVRTKLDHFDRYFNAITGFNGTGKSNILDGICFVLGLTNLKRARVANMYDLVYKKGQAGVKKASVSITFDNTDKANSPLAYQKFDEIIVTRQITMGSSTKYMINGTRATQSMVADFFQSVRLDVNNPNFLIMQGKVTGVSRMKAEGILGMVEETAGTKMYDRKKAESEKRMADRQKKLEELDRVLNEEIKPKLKDLYRQQAVYEKYETAKEKKESYKKLLQAHEYVELKNITDAGDGDVEQLQNQIAELKHENSSLKEEKMKLEGSIKQKEVEMAQNNSTLKLIDDQKAEKYKESEVQGSKVEFADRDLKKAREALKAHDKEQKNNDANEEVLQRELERAKQAYDEIKAEYGKVQERIASMEGQLSGLSGDGHNKGTLKEQLMAKKKNVSEKESEINRFKLSINAFNKSMKEKQNKSTRGKARWERLVKQRDEQAHRLQLISEQLDSEGMDPEAQQKEREHVRKLEEERDSLKHQMRKYQPDRRFFAEIGQRFRGDKRRVYGTVAQLMKVKNPEKYAKAIETCLGGNMFNIVVEDKDTGKQLIKAAESRINVLPLRNITHRSPDGRRLSEARKQHATNPDDIQFAIDCIEFDPKFTPIMEYCFGSVMICPDISVARKIAYDKRVGVKGISLDGDVADPRGTMEGGSSSRNRMGPLQQFTIHNESKRRYEDVNNRCEMARQRMLSAQEKWREFERMNNEREMLKNNIAGLDEQIQNTEFQNLKDEVDRLAAQIDDAKAKMLPIVEEVKGLKQEIRELDQEIRDFEREREKKTKEMKNKIKADKKILEQIKRKLNKANQERQKKELEIQNAHKEKEEASGKREELAQEIVECEKKLDAEKDKRLDLEKEYKILQNKLESAQKALEAESKEIELMRDRIHKIEERVLELQNEIEIAVENESRMRRNKQVAKQRVEQLEKTQSWILEHRENFGKAGSDFDFAKFPREAVEKKLKEYEKVLDGMAGKVNKQVQQQFQRNNEEAKELRKRKKLVDEDRKTLENVIASLEQKKKDAVENVWRRVNKFFNSIFSKLLPGTSCKLEPLPGKTVHEGLEIKVAFNGQWRESLSELSGGQKSLLSLSLILALLKHKPAPMYILDEIDSALDLSHTQNIGVMLKTHFKDSQFIVVSLKPGLFNNANCLFKTRLANGVSQVDRHAGGTPV